MFHFLSDNFGISDGYFKNVYMKRLSSLANRQALSIKKTRRNGHDLQILILCYATSSSWDLKFNFILVLNLSFIRYTMLDSSIIA